MRSPRVLLERMKERGVTNPFRTLHTVHCELLYMAHVLAINILYHFEIKIVTSFFWLFSNIIYLVY